MRKILSRYKYSLLTACSVLVALLVVVLGLFPKMQAASGILGAIRTEIGNAQILENIEGSPDSLIANYKKLSSEMDSYINVSVSSSKLLTFIVDAAKRNDVVLQDLSTGEVSNRGENLVYPVNFKASSDFKRFLRFLTSLENSTYCVNVEHVDMQADYASVRLSVLSKGASGE